MHHVKMLVVGLFGLALTMAGLALPASAEGVDTQAPVVTIGFPVGLPYYSRNTSQATFTVTDDVGVVRTQCALDDAAYVACTSPWSISRPSDGPHEVHIRATDAAGNTTTATKAFVEDHTPPVVRLSARPRAYTNDRTATFAWTLSDALSGVRSWSCQLDGHAISGCTDTGITLTNLPEGGHTLMLQVKDKAGNGNPNNVYLDWDVDTTAPEIDVTNAPRATTLDRSATIGFTVAPDWSSSTAECQLDDQPAQPCWTRSVTCDDLALGEHRVVIRIRDRAGNPAEQTVAWKVVARPDAPGDVTAVAGNQEATVSWTPSSEHGLPVTGYVITASPGGHTVTVPADRAAASLAGLENGTAYTFTVTATTSTLGGSLESVPSEPVTPAGWPDLPRQVTAERRDHAALVSWNPVDGDGAPIADYTIKVSPGDRTLTVPGDQTSALVDGLAEVGPYTFWVTARTRVGVGPTSAPVSVVFAEVPAAPTHVRAVPGNHAATISWTPPNEDGGTPVTGYTITVRPGGRTVDIGTETTSWTVSGLTNGSAYTLTVSATNAAGKSAPSALSNTVVPAGVPDRVDRPRLTRKGTRTVVVRWSAPDDNSSVIKRYRVMSSTGRAQTVGAGVRRVAFSSLPKGRHTFWVVAVNGIGSSRPSHPAVIRLR
ncbi:fibronectin type III domain-containing protein [Nocardioides sp.]|uniref:fibronectin type III domain-containing protein n=1 Tax=Nocardioides sp. TaxID=35761 RepID=UPI0025FCCAB5|nr:fibronectin type III domain-containing protein [Nocardioides sp.]